MRLTPFDRGDHSVESERSVENVDALAATTSHRGGDASGGNFGASYPPGWIKTDDGRPRH